MPVPWKIKSQKSPLQPPVPSGGGFVARGQPPVAKNSVGGDAIWLPRPSEVAILSLLPLTFQNSWSAGRMMSQQQIQGDEKVPIQTDSHSEWPGGSTVAPETILLKGNVRQAVFPLDFLLLAPHSPPTRLDFGLFKLQESCQACRRKLNYINSKALVFRH
jgi:hypothetical protein